MIRAELAVAAIALVSTGAVASAQAQTQTASAEPAIWDHNGSVVYLVANGQSREFHYQKPRAGMLEVGVRLESGTEHRIRLKHLYSLLPEANPHGC